MSQMRARVSVQPIAFGEKVMFNGYEIWKADGRKMHQIPRDADEGSACGALHEDVSVECEDTIEAGGCRTFNQKSLRAARIIESDDAEGNGNRNLIKRCGLTWK